MPGKLTNEVKVRFDDIEYSVLLRQSEQDNRAPAQYLKTLWLVALRQKIAQDEEAGEFNRRGDEGRGGPGSGFADTERG